MDEQRKSRSKNKHVKWDEEKLKQTQQYRGTFQKINQPKTPYHGNSSEQEEIEGEVKTEQQIQVEESLRQAHKNRDSNRKAKVDLGALNAKLKAEMAKFKEQEGEPMEQQTETEEQRKKKEEFKKKRAQHYNEFKKIQEARQQHHDSDEDV